TNGAGVATEERLHEPYGAALPALGADYVYEPIGWNAKPVEELTEWSDHGARWYGTQMGRWLSVDPPLKVPALDHEGGFASPYRFARANPVQMWDADGHGSINGWPELPARQKRELLRNASSGCHGGSCLDALVSAWAETMDIITDMAP